MKITLILATPLLWLMWAFKCDSVFRIGFYVVENVGIGEKIMWLACSGAEICPKLSASAAKLLSYITCRTCARKHYCSFSPEHVSNFLFFPIPPFSTMYNPILNTESHSDAQISHKRGVAKINVIFMGVYL